MSEEIKTTNTEQPTTPTPEASGGQGEKMFTQDEVNRIVSERLAREKRRSESVKRLWRPGRIGRLAKTTLTAYPLRISIKPPYWRHWTPATPRNSRPRRKS